jgi:RNA polymerase sigma factor (sigma-70 family)
VDEEVLLIKQLLVGDQTALRVIVERFSPIVLGLAHKVVGQASLAEEAAQDTFLALWRRPEAFDPERGTLRAFLLGVVHHKAIDLVRREARARRPADALMAEAQATSTSDPGYEAMEEVEARHAVQSALATLPACQREAIVLAYFGGRSSREVAAELLIPEGTAKTRLRDGLIRMRELLPTRWEQT